MLQNRVYSVVISDMGRTEGGSRKDMAGLDLLEKMSGLNISTPFIAYGSLRAGDPVIPKTLYEAGAVLVTNQASEVLAKVAELVADA